MSAEVFWIVFPFWAQAFVLTLVIELPVFAVVARWRRRKADCAPLWRLLAAGAVGTCITHPLLWFVYPRFVQDYTTYIISGELLIPVIESFTFWLVARPIALRRAFVASFAANALSFGLGVLARLLGLVS